MTNLYFILVKKAIIYYLYSKKHISDHIIREFDIILDPIFIKNFIFNRFNREKNKFMPESDHKWQFKNTADR